MCPLRVSPLLPLNEEYAEQIIAEGDTIIIHYSLYIIHLFCFAKFEFIAISSKEKYT